jgi:hypothetical protein
VRNRTAAGPDAQIVVNRQRAIRQLLLDGEAGFTGLHRRRLVDPELAALLSFLLANETALRPRRQSSP